jgi:hypothetical protein
MIRYTYTSQKPQGSSDRRSCTVNALAITTGVSWEIAHAALKSAGRKNGRGVYMVQVIRSRKLEDSGFYFTEIPVDARAGFKHFTNGQPYNPNRVTLDRFAREHRTGAYYLIKSGHAFALVDGVVRDWQANGSRSLIQRAYRVEYRPAGTTPDPAPAQPEPARIQAEFIFEQ